MIPVEQIGHVAAAALGSFDQVMNWLGLAGGKDQGRNYFPLNPTRSDQRPGSFSVNRDTGAWMDGATGDKGGDLVSLVAYLQSCKQGQAAQRLAEFLGLSPMNGGSAQERAQRDAGTAARGQSSSSPRQTSSGPAKGPQAVCLMPVPQDAPPPPMAHPRHGRPVVRETYTTAGGALCFFDDRYEPPGERKQFSPLTCWEWPDGRRAWQFKAPPAPRPLLGLPELAAKPAPAVLVEGGKARTAAARLLPEHPVLTWSGGAQAVAKTDFGPLAGREVWLWADNDEAGQKAARSLITALAAVGAGPVKVLDLRLLAQTPGEVEGVPVLSPGGELNPGDDAADLLARGWTAGHLALILPAALSEAEAEPARSSTDGESMPAASASVEEGGEDAKPRRFELTERGVLFHEPDKAPRWICAPVEVAALVRDPRNTGWGLLVDFSDPDRHPHRVIVPMQLFRGEGLEAIGMLLDHGLKIAPRGRALVVEYLQTAVTRERARVTNRTGWHEAGPEGAAFVHPDQAFGGGGGAWIFEGEGPAHPFTIRGSLKGWQHDVAALCEDNSRLAFAVSLAFAAPLLYLVGAESGGFHFRSNSSDGKTTALRVAASVCGGADYMQRWRATDNGLEAVAAQHCDAPLLLDELAQIDPKVAGEVAYMLANGGGKARAGRTGGSREKASWRTLFLSAGEIGLAEHMGEVGKTVRAGQEARLAEIPADAGAGIGLFETLHGHVSGSEFAKALAEGARRHYGTAFVCYLRELAARQHEVAAAVKEAQRQFEAACLSEEAHGQARRVAGRFALVGAGGELATKWGVTGWAPGRALQAARTCFEAWLKRRGGEGNAEERAMLGAVRDFLRRYGESAFTDWERPANDTDKHAPVRSDRAGYRRHNAAADAPEFFVFAETWRSRVCKGFDAAAVGRLLLARGYVRRGTELDRPWLIKQTLPTEGRPRVVHILPALMDGDDD